LRDEFEENAYKHECPAYNKTCDHQAAHFENLVLNVIACMTDGMTGGSFTWPH
jgi:hypothetical protein